jgi:tetratricopeptide (TPR) repeat protein
VSFERRAEIYPNVAIHQYLKGNRTMDTMQEIEKRKREAEEKKIYEKGRWVLCNCGSYEHTQTGENSARIEREYADQKIVIKSIDHEAADETGEGSSDHHMEIWSRNQIEAIQDSVSERVFRATDHFRSFYIEEDYKETKFVQIEGYIPGEWEFHLEELYIVAQEKWHKEQEERKKKILTEQMKSFGLPEGEGRSGPDSGKLGGQGEFTRAPAALLAPERENISATESHYTSCASCNSQIDLPAKFCPMCGTALHLITTQPEQSTDESTILATSANAEKSEVEELLVKGRIAAFFKDRPEEAIAHLRSALSQGLPPRDEVYARADLGVVLMGHAATVGMTNIGLASSDMFKKGAEEIETALRLDLEHHTGFFAEKETRVHYISGLVGAYVCECELLEQQNDRKQLIFYLTEKINLLEKLPASPAAPLYNRLGILLKEDGKKSEARKAFIKATNSELPKEGMHHYELILQDMQYARENAEKVRTLIDAYHSLSEWPRVFVAAGVGVFLGLAFFGSGLVFVLLYLPVLLAAILVVAKAITLVSLSDRLDNWLTDTKKHVDERSDLISEFISKPYLLVVGKIMEWSQGIEDQFVRSGVRIASYVLVITAPLFVLIGLLRRLLS